MRAARVVTLLITMIFCARGAFADSDEAAAAPEPAGSAAPAPEPSGSAEPAREAAAADGDADDDDAAEPPLPPDTAEYKAAFQGVPTVIDDASLEARPADQELAPSLTADQLRGMVKLARDKVLSRMQAKMERKSNERMAKINSFIRWFSLAGLLLLAMPLVLRNRYPGHGKTMFKYSALAAVTFFVTVNLFGGVVLGFRTVQAHIGKETNPQLRIASGFFDTISDHAEDYLVMGKELFAPTLAHLQDDNDEQPAAVLIENGKKLIKDADVFVRIANLFKKLDVVFAILPTILLLVTMLLFVLAIKPTLLEIIRLPITATSGEVGIGRSVVTRAMRRVLGELLATLCTIGVLVVLTLLAGMILGRIVGPALDALIGYFSLGIIYLQFVKGASSALVFTMLLGVIVFLVLNLAVVIASMSIFLGKSQKIFQRRFNDGTPLGTHRRFWTWGTAAVLVAQLLPWLFIAIADWGLDKLDEKLVGNVTDPAQIPWGTIMLVGPFALVGGFVLVFWAGRGLRSIVYLARYRV